MTDTETQVARALLEIDAVGFRPARPITFKSGIKSPVYVDNRRLPFWPEQWRVVLQGFAALLAEQAIPFDVVAGIEAAGIPHSAVLGYILQKPSVFVRKQAKEHGTRSRVEGGSVTGQRVLLVEDLVTTGGSSLAGVEALRQDGAAVTHCLCIVTYGFAEAVESFATAQVELLPLTPFTTIVGEAVRLGKLDAATRAGVEDWFSDPRGWAGRHGFEDELG